MSVTATGSAVAWPPSPDRKTVQYIATSAVTAHPGTRVRLTKAQAERRRGRVGPADKNGFATVLLPFQFKRGEVFETAADLPKNMADLVVDPEAGLAKAQASAAASTASAA